MSDHTPRTPDEILDHLFALERRDEDDANVAVFAIVRGMMAIGASGLTRCHALTEAAGFRVIEFTRPQLLVNLLMATYSVRHTPARRAFAEVARGRLVDLVGAARADAIVGRLV